jgi:hypothetical protein
MCCSRIRSLLTVHRKSHVSGFSCNYSGSKFQGSRLPWRDLLYVPGTIALNATIDVSTQWDKEARSGPRVQIASKEVRSAANGAGKGRALREAVRKALKRRLGPESGFWV